MEEIKYYSKNGKVYNYREGEVSRNDHVLHDEFWEYAIKCTKICEKIASVAKFKFTDGGGRGSWIDHVVSRRGWPNDHV